MDRCGQDLSTLIDDPSLQRIENSQSQLFGAAGSRCRGQGHRGLNTFNHKDVHGLGGRTADVEELAAAAAAGCEQRGDAHQEPWRGRGEAMITVNGEVWSPGSGPGAAAESLADELRLVRVRVPDTGREAEWGRGGAACGFGSSLCFTAGASGDESAAGVGGEHGGEPVVDSQRQINNSGMHDQAAGARWSLDGGELGDAQEYGGGSGDAQELGDGIGSADMTGARWTLEAGGPGDAQESGGGPGDADGSGGAQPEPDLVIEVAGRRVRAHKAVLCTRSEFFRARRSRQVVRVRGIALTVMRALLDHAYGARLQAPTVGGAPDGDVDAHAAAALFAAAHALQMPGAVRAAERALREQLRARACGQLLDVAKRMRAPDLADLCLGFMSAHYLDVLRDPAVYGRLTAAERELILRRREEAGARSLLLAELGDGHERSGASSRDSSRAHSPCSPERAPDEEEVEGDGGARWVHRRDARTGEWRRLSRVPEAVSGARGCGVCALHGYLFVAGGTRGGDELAGPRPSARALSWEPATGAWREARAMGRARARPRLAALDGRVYALGGDCELAVERYDPRCDRWSPVAPLPRGAFAITPQAAACSGRLYLTGGSLSARLLAYEPRRDEWDECPGSPGPSGRAVALLARPPWLYRLELHRDQSSLSVHRYNTAGRVWVRAACISPGPGPGPSLHLQPARCALLGRSVYLLGRAALLRLLLPRDGGGYRGRRRQGEGAEGQQQQQQEGGEEEDGEDFSYRLLPPCLQARGPLFPVVLALPESPRDGPGSG
ncbi:LOW QUALITY PROTEIN: kelch repeat and BTB domain-containing protein 11-like [Leucoraja erinacea]|uniref:LOW QUALITY PROTEIN: kelch repeat and BTB domain-containing protein 11-like n=1 Tax=Leucoraja erinaceus TaxID=7782 RepID=UPI0024553F42|nr:LOW QUALITY PROTEIN: kelch repeat and BTB domain-containing protein 11-like [Leucoraja erinacea]